ncbi:unnamed protein product [Closterium sp. NIES-54]
MLHCIGCVTDAWRAQFPDATEIPRWGDLLKSGVAIFDLDYDAILAAMYAVSISTEGDCYLCVPPDPGIEAAALGASESVAPGAGEAALSGTASAQVLHTFTLDSGASRSFFRDCTTLSPLSQPVALSLADPSGGPVLAHSSTVLPCPAVPSGSLCGLHLPSFSTNLVSGADLQYAWVDQFTPGGQRVTHCSCIRKGRHLATFTRQPGSSLYTLTTVSPPVAEPGQVAASGQVFAAASRSGPESAPCSCGLLSHQTLLWHHCLGHQTLLWHGLPCPCHWSSPVSPSPSPGACPYLRSLPRVRGQGHKCYFLLVVDDYSRYTTVFPLRRKGEVTEVLIDWIRAICRQLSESFGSDLPVLRLHSDRGGEFSSDLLGAFCRAEGIRHTFTLSASPQKNGIVERRIGMVMDVARMSMIHAAAPHFLWPFAVQYATHQINLQPLVSMPETTPTLQWTGKVGDASAFRVWGSRAFIRDLSADKLSSRAVPCDVTFDESVPYYHLFPYRIAPLPPPAALPHARSPPVEPVEVAVDSSAARGVEPAGVGSGGAEPERAEPGGAESGGAEPGVAESGGAEPDGAEPARVESGGAAPGGPSGASSRQDPLSPQQLHEWFACRWSRAAGAGGATGAGGSTAAGDAGGSGVTAGGTARAGAAGGTGAGATGAAEAFGGSAGAGGAGGAGAPGGARIGATGAAGGAAGVGGVGPDTRGAGAVPVGSRGAARPRPYFVPLLEQPASPLPAPSPYTGPTRGLTERREPESRPASPVCATCTSRHGSRQRPPPVPGMHHMALRPSTAPQRVPLRSPPASSLSALANLESESLRATSPTVTRLLASLVTDPSFESTATSALLAELVDFAAHCRLDYAASLVADSASVCPPSVGGECALGTDVLEDRQEEFECFAAAVPHLVSMLLAHEGDPDAPDISTPRSYAEAIEGPYSSQWQAAMDGKMASWKSTGTYVDEAPLPGANIWHDTLRTTLAALGFAPSTADPSLFLHTDTTLPLFYILVYVDDLVFATIDTAGLAHVKSELQKRHTCTDLGELRSYLGLQITWDRARRTITLTQSHMVQQVFQRFNFTYSSPQAPCLSTRHLLSALPSEESVEPSGPYLELFGCLMYLMTCTRPDLAYPLSILARYVAPGRHRPEHMDAAKRVLRYLCSTSGTGLVLGGRARVVLTSQADASWVDDLATQRPSKGYTFSLGSGSVLWRSTRSSSVLSSSCEAEIYAVAMAAQELRWLTYLLTELGEVPRSPPVLYVDNKAMLALCQEHRLEHRTKHIALRYFLTRELQQRGQLCLAYVATRANTADIFTKALQPCDHQRFLYYARFPTSPAVAAPAVAAPAVAALAVEAPAAVKAPAAVAAPATVAPPAVEAPAALAAPAIDAWHAQFPDDVELPRWGDLLKQNVVIFDLDFYAILAAMYAVTDSAEGDCYLSVPPDPGIGDAALGASASAAPCTGKSVAPGAGESALSGTAPTKALHTFTLDSGASRSFFRDSTTLTPLSRPVAVSLADPSEGPVLAHSSTVLPCPAAPSGLLSGLHLPSFSTNLVSGADLQDMWVDQFTPEGQCVTHCTCSRTGRHLATFIRQPGSSLYTLTTASLPVTASSQVAASGQVLAAASSPSPASAPCSCRPLSHEILLWHHRLGHPSLPRLRGMASRTLVSGLPGPSLPSSGACPYLCSLCRGPTVRRSSLLRGHERYFLLVVDDYSRCTTVAPLRCKGEVTEVLIDWIRGTRRQLSESFGSDLLMAFCRAEGIRQTFTLPASPQQNGIAERRIGMVMDVARTSMIHAAAPHFLWPYAVQYVAHQINLQPRVSLPETTPTLRWTGKVGDASVFRVDPVEVAVDSSTARGAEPAGAGPGGAEPWVAESEGAERAGAEPERVEPGVSEPGGAEFEGAEPGGAEPEHAESGGPPGAAGAGAAGAAGPGGAGAGGAGAVGGPTSVGAAGGATGAVAAGGAAGAGAAGPGDVGAGGTGAVGGPAGVGTARSAGAASPGGARTRGTRAAWTGGAAGVGAVCAVVVAPGGAAGAGATRGTGAGGAAGFVAGDPGAEVTCGVFAVSGGAARPWPYYVPLLQQVLGPPPSTGPTPPLLSPPPVQSQSQLQPASPLPGHSPYTAPTRGLTERREPESRPASPESRPASPESRPESHVCAVRTGRRVPRQRPRPVPGTHSMTLRLSTAPQGVPPPAPPASSLPNGPDPESDSLRAASPTVTRFLATVVTDPSFESTAASALVAELVDFAAACRLDYAASLVAESESASVCPPSVGGECALGTDVLEDRQEEFECFAAAFPHLVSMLLAPEQDPDAPDIPTLRSYAEAIEGPYSSQWQTAMDTEMASLKSTGTYVDEVPPPGANIVSGMWIFRVKRPPGSPPVFKARYVARGFTFLQGSLHEEIWLRRPPGFTGLFPAGTQSSLRRPVYGLRQAPREWHDTLRTTLAALGFAPSTSDPSLFLRTDTTLPPFYVLVYVDELVFATANTEALAHMKSELHKRHTCTDLGELTSYLGLRITRDRAQRTITLTQSHMVQQVLQRFGFTYSSPRSTPLPTGHSLLAPPSDESVEPSGLYPELVGCLMYLMTYTRPDLAFPLSILARYVAPGRDRKEHMDAAKRVLRYLCSTSGMGLVLGRRA